LRQAQATQNAARDSSHPAADLPGSSFSDAIHLAACQATQILPMSPDLPADLFTCCLTSPIETSLRHFVLQDPLRRNISTSSNDPRSRVTVDMVMRIPGDLKDRRTPLGELNWIFTAVTDTIAWSSFPRDIFNRLFRQDLLVAALFRNFLLAQRIMQTYHCTPMSIPELPSTHNHPLWNSWDLAVDACLAQLPELLDLQAANEAGTSNVSPMSVYRPSNFFAQHLQAFEVWLQHGGAVSTKLANSTTNGNGKSAAHRAPPEQLPIVLQVLLSQAHRLRALILLSRFVDLGPWAVHLSLSIGIFPYVQKLLQSPAIELKPVLIFIWARILAVDKSCQVDLLRDAGYNYFAQILGPYPNTPGAGPGGAPLAIPNANEHRAMCAFILSILCRNFKPGQTACLAINVFDACMARLQEDDWLLKTWCLLCIAQLWADNDDAKSLFMVNPARQGELLMALRSTAVEVRAAALYAFGTLLGASSAPVDSSEAKGGGGTGAQLGMTEMQQMEVEAGLAFACMMSVKEDASPMVRKELVVVISSVVREWRGWLVCAAWVYYEQEVALSKAESGASDTEGGGIRSVVTEALDEWVQNPDLSPEEHQRNLTFLSSFKVLFETLLDFSVDPDTEVALKASSVVDYIIALLLDSAFVRVRGSAVPSLLAKRRPPLNVRQYAAAQGDGSRLPNGVPPGPKRAETDNPSGTVNGTLPGLKRSGSVAHALRSLATMTGFLSPDTPETPSSPVEAQPEAQDYVQSSVSAYKSPYPDASHQRILPEGHQASPVRTSSGGILRGAVAGHGASAGTSGLSRVGAGLAMSGRNQAEMNMEPARAVDVLEALSEEDMERLRIRRLRGTQAGGDVDGRLANNGLARPNDLGLGMVAKEVKDDVLPLKSGFYDWAMEYFREPQMKVSEADPVSNGRLELRMCFWTCGRRGVV
jgi:regulator-associated protein of mTOR